MLFWFLHVMEIMTRKKSRQEEWSNILGGADFKLVGEEESQDTYVNAFTEEPS